MGVIAVHVNWRHSVVSFWLQSTRFQTPPLLSSSQRRTKHCVGTVRRRHFGSCTECLCV